jgi:membrane-anchored glycerophosphoryl diester phosphodiesterase (GDPDase)
MISYESCKWYVKLWRKRWYLYAIFLHIKNYINVELWIDYLLYQQLSDNEKKKLRISWKEIKRHVELSKMYKFSSKCERED